MPEATASYCAPRIASVEGAGIGSTSGAYTGGCTLAVMRSNSNTSPPSAPAPAPAAPETTLSSDISLVCTDTHALTTVHGCGIIAAIECGVQRPLSQNFTTDVKAVRSDHTQSHSHHIHFAHHGQPPVPSRVARPATLCAQRAEHDLPAGCVLWRGVGRRGGVWRRRSYVSACCCCCYYGCASRPCLTVRCLGAQRSSRSRAAMLGCSCGSCALGSSTSYWKATSRTTTRPSLA